MLKKGISVIIMLVMAFVSINLAVAAAGGPDGNKRKGKYIYRKVYKACMKTGEVQSATPKISPADKPMAQWTAIFESRNFEEFGCESSWAELSDKDVGDIYAYFYHHAADSPSPATCK